VPVRGRDGKTLYRLESATDTPLTMLRHVSDYDMERKEKDFTKSKIITSKQEKIGLPLKVAKVKRIVQLPLMTECLIYSTIQISLKTQILILPLKV
jgi:hypothetical protein